MNPLCLETHGDKLTLTKTGTDAARLDAQRHLLRGEPIKVVFPDGLRGDATAGGRREKLIEALTSWLAWREFR